MATQDYYNANNDSFVFTLFIITRANTGMQTSSLELKGSSFTLSVLHIKHQDLDKVAQELDSKLAIAPQFFLGRL